MNGHDAPAFPEPFRIVGPLRPVHEFVVGDGERIAEQFHIFIRQPETDTGAEIMITGDHIVITEAVRSFPGNADRDPVLIGRELLMNHAGREFIIKSSVFLHHYLHLLIQLCFH